MTEHVVRVGTLRTAVAVVADPATAAPLRGRLDRALGELLPPLLAEVAGPLLDPHHGVVRVRRLRLRLDATGPLTEVALARLLADRIAAALAEALADPGADVRSWEDHAAYLAGYVETLLGVEPGPSWPFAEFSALTVLSPTEAAVEVLRARPAVLVRLAANGTRAGNPTRILGALDDSTCATLVDALLDAASPRPPDAADLSALGAVLDLPALPVPAPVVPRTALSLLLRRAALPPRTDVLRLGRAAVTVGALLACPAAGRERLTTEADPAGLAAALAEEAAALPPRLRMVLRESLADPTARTALAGLLPSPPATGRGGRAGAAAGAAPTGTLDRAAPGAPRGPRHGIPSPVAGVTLLLPGVLRHGLHELLTAPQLRAAVLGTLGEEAARSAALDPFLAALLPADPRADVGTAPPLPARAVDGLLPQTRHLLTDSSGVAGWGGLLLADFAGRLPGLARSSAGYLRRQFLRTPGRLHLTEHVAAVTLDGPPLAVVLAMAGFQGNQGPLPHLGGRRLTIVLSGLHP